MMEMANKVLINLPVKNLSLSVSFFEKLGFRFNNLLSDELAACMIIHDHVFVMLLSNDYFISNTKKQISDPALYSEVIITIYMDSKNEIRKIISIARELGTEIFSEAEDRMWMYRHGFSDPDGHLWELIYIDSSLVPNPEI